MHANAPGGGGGGGAGGKQRWVVGAVLAAAGMVVLLSVNHLHGQVESLRAELVRMRADHHAAAAAAAQAAPAASSEKDGRGHNEPGPIFYDETGLATHLMKKSPPALPGIPTKVENDPRDAEKKLYGGKGDALHLGGWTLDDGDGQSPALYQFLIKVLNVKSLLDVGCGRGISTKFFLDKNVDVLCVEGSHDGVLHSLLPRERIVEHDYSRGPWWPDKTYDFAWSVEFLEHVGRQYMRNYMSTFKQAAIVMVTHSFWGGYHHVEVHPNGPPFEQGYWFRSRFEAAGFVHSQPLTDLVHRIVAKGWTKEKTGQHLQYTSDVFINPRVMGLPQHQHLVGGPGCWHDGGYLIPCGGVDALPAEFQPVWKGVFEGAFDKEAPESKTMTEGWDLDKKPPM